MMQALETIWVSASISVLRELLETQLGFNYCSDVLETLEIVLFYSLPDLRWKE